MTLDWEESVKIGEGNWGWEVGKFGNRREGLEERSMNSDSLEHKINVKCKMSRYGL